MPRIYVIMSHTGTYLSKLIRRVTGNTYNHVSISMTEDLSQMYSFGRRNPYNAIRGGFVQEFQHKGTFKRFKNTICKILELEVSDESYSIISDILKRFIEEKKRFKFNFLGVLFARKNINYQKSYRKFYCSQFVKYLLVCAHIIPEDFFGNVVTPQDFARIKRALPVYEGYLRDFSPELIVRPEPMPDPVEIVLEKPSFEEEKEASPMGVPSQDAEEVEKVKAQSSRILDKKTVEAALAESTTASLAEAAAASDRENE